MNALDVVRILMDDLTIHLTTIVSVDSATQITIALATDDAAAAGNYVKVYHPDDGVPGTLAHVGNDTFEHGEWSGHRKAAFYIDGQNAPGCGGTILRDVIIENNTGFGIFIKDYNNAFTPVRLENVWFESNATDTAVDLGDGFGVRVSQDIYFENVDNAIISGSHIQKATFIDSPVELDNCFFDNALTVLTVTNTDNKNNVTITNAHLDGWGEALTGASDVIIKSIKANDREGGDGVARCWRAPQLTPVQGNTITGGVIRESNRGDTGEDWLGVGVDPDVARDGYVAGLSHETASQYTFLDGDDYIAPATMATTETTAGKAYMMSLEIKVDSGLANIGAIKWGSAYNFTRGNADGLLTEGEWSTIAFVGRLATGNSGAIRPQITMATGGGSDNATVTIGASQFHEFDDVQDAYDYYNKGVHTYQAKSSTRVRRTDSATRATTITAADDTELLGWNLDADTWYKVSGAIILDTDATADFRYRFDFSNAAQVINIACFYIQSGATTAAPQLNTTVVAVAGSTADQLVEYSGVFQTNATTGGDVAFQWAQGTSNAYATKLYAGSWITIERIFDPD
jgi:hypothetical protein